jgi:hypothetical protein
MSWRSSTHTQNGRAPWPRAEICCAASTSGLIVVTQLDLLTGRHNRNQIAFLKRDWEFATLQILVSEPNRKFRQI